MGGNGDEQRRDGSDYDCSGEETVATRAATHYSKMLRRNIIQSRVCKAEQALAKGTSRKQGPKSPSCRFRGPKLIITITIIITIIITITIITITIVITITIITIITIIITITITITICRYVLVADRVESLGFPMQLA